MKLTDKKKREIASELPDKYDYMDNLPMRGWAWEFVRRNVQYIATFSKLEKLVKEGSWNDECNKILLELQKIASPAGLLIGRVSSASPFDRNNFLVFNIPPYEEDKAGLNKFFGNSHHEGVVPRPDKSYYDFFKKLITKKKIPDNELYKLFSHSPLPFIYQIPDYQIYESFNVLLNQKTTLMLSPDSDVLEI